jgi:predicted amidohydrolase
VFATGFTMYPERIAVDEGGPNEQFLQEQARLHDAYVVASIAQRGPDGKFRNNAVVAGPDGATRRYAKIHPFSYSGEHEHYTAGTDFLTVDVDDLRVSVFVCYDLRFADEFWALAHDTDCYLIVANWPESQRHHWQSLLVARAIENQAYVVGVNRVGEGGRLAYSGDSRIIDPLGEVIAGGARTEATLIAEVDPAMVRDVRARYPFLQDRR